MRRWLIIGCAMLVWGCEENVNLTTPSGGSDRPTINVACSEGDHHRDRPVINIPKPDPTVRCDRGGGTP